MTYGDPPPFCNCGWGGPGPCPCPRNRQLQPWPIVPVPPIQTGWVCPRCGTVHSPYTPSCFGCAPVSATGTFDPETIGAAIRFAARRTPEPGKDGNNG